VIRDAHLLQLLGRRNDLCAQRIVLLLGGEQRVLGLGDLVSDLLPLLLQTLCHLLHRRLLRVELGDLRSERAVLRLELGDARLLRRALRVNRANLGDQLVVLRLELRLVLHETVRFRRELLVALHPILAEFGKVDHRREVAAQARALRVEHVLHREVRDAHRAHQLVAARRTRAHGASCACDHSHARMGAHARASAA